MSDSKNILYIFSFMLLILTGCEAESSWAPLPNTGEEPVEVRFHASMVGASVTVSRSEYTEENPLEVNEKVGIWNEYYNNLSLTCGEKTEKKTQLKMTSGGRVYYPYGIYNMTIYAYAPYMEALEEGGKLKVTTEWEPEAEGVKDPIWGKTEVNKETGAKFVNVPFNFTHQMARLRIQFEATEVNFTDLNVYLTFDRPQYGVMNLKDGSMTASDESTTYTLVPQDLETIYDRTVLSGSILKNIRVTLEDDENTYEYSHPWEKTFDASGKIHTITIRPEAIRTNQNTILQPKNKEL